MYYSAASFCFGANVEFNYLYLLDLNLTKEEVIEEIIDLRQDIEDFDRTIEDEKIKTLTDLESYMIVKERLLEAYDFLGLVEQSINNNITNLRNLAYAIERINSAKSWAQFLDNTGKEFDFNDEIIENACRTKLSEVEERLQYVQIYLPQNLEGTRKELEYAYKDLRDANYELCLFKASKAKANVDTVLSVFGVRTSNVGTIINQKLDIVERNLVEGTEKGIFPIVGYSYYEYANSLKDSDPFSALLYAEYALELSNLDIYFKNAEVKKIKLPSKIDGRLLLVLIMGVILGILASKIIDRDFLKRKRPKSKKRKS